MKQGYKAKAGLDTANRIIDSMTNTDRNFLAADQIPKSKCLKNTNILTGTLSTREGET